MVVLNHPPTDCSLMPPIFQDLRFGIKFILSSKIDIIDAGEGLNSSHGSSTHNNLPFLFAFFSPSLMTEETLHNVWLDNITFYQ